MRFGFSTNIEGKFGRKALIQKMQQQLPQLYRIARGIVGHQGDAEDLVHDACVKALASLDKASFESDPQFYAWLKRILINTYRDQYRRSVRSPVRLADPHAGSEANENVVEMVLSTEPSPAENVHLDQSSSAIDRAFTALAPEVRVVSALFLISGLSYQVIAEITDCPVGTVMSRLARGRASLRQALSLYYLDDEDLKAQLAGIGAPL